MKRLHALSSSTCLVLAVVLAAYAGGCLCLGESKPETSATTLIESTTTLVLTQSTTTAYQTTIVPVTTTTMLETAISIITSTTTTAIAASTTSTTKSSLRTSTTTTSTTIPTCFGEGNGGIKLSKDDKNEGKLYISFTGSDGRRYDNVGMYQGPYSAGDTFILGGNAYQYVDYSMNGNSGSCNTEIVHFRNLIGGNTDKLVLTAYTGPAVTLTTASFEDAARNHDTINIEPDENCNDTYVFLLKDVERVTGVSLIFDGGNIYFVSSNPDGTVPDQEIGVWGRNASGGTGQTGAAFKSFHDGGGRISIYAFDEGASDANFDGDTGDALVLLSDEKGEIAVIDLYDVNHAGSGGYYRMSVKGMYESNWNDHTGIVSKDPIDASLEREDDTLLILPASGNRISVDYGAMRSILDVMICPSVYYYI